MLNSSGPQAQQPMARRCQSDNTINECFRKGAGLGANGQLKVSPGKQSSLGEQHDLTVTEQNRKLDLRCEFVQI